jgi:hypothetical protein
MPRRPVLWSRGGLLDYLAPPCTGSRASDISQRLFLKWSSAKFVAILRAQAPKLSCRIKSRMRPVHFPERLLRQIFGNLAVTHDSHNPAAYLTLKLVEQRLERVVLAPRKPPQKFHFVLYFLLLMQYEYRYIYLLGAKYRRDREAGGNLRAAGFD